MVGLGYITYFRMTSSRVPGQPEMSHLVEVHVAVHAPFQVLGMCMVPRPGPVFVYVRTYVHHVM